jgi:PKD repeat protein
MVAAVGLAASSMTLALPAITLVSPLTATHTSVLAASGGDPVIAAAGDIACDPLDSKFNGGAGASNGCRERYTSDLLVNTGLTAVLALGDNQYYCGSYAAFMGSYDLSWGRVKSITYPSVGNHEYLTHGGSSPSTGCDSTNTGAAGYYQYYGARAGDPTQGYYSFDIGAWHLIALNTQCSSVGGCSASSPQGKWLAADLARHPNQCTLAFWHIPLFSSGGRASSNSNGFWQLLYSAHADIILNGHDHIYERFAPQTPTGAPDPVNGIREFIVGTGGANLTSLTTTAANSEVRNASTFGVLDLTLHSTGYDWRFVPEAGKTFTDSGSGTCHASGGGGGGGGDTQKPTVPSITSATAPSSGRVDLAWTTASDNVGVAGYTVYRNGTQIATTTGPTATSYSDLTVSPSTTYSYTVDAFDAANNHSAQSTAAIVTTPGTSATTTIGDIADSYIDTSKPTTNYGTSTSLRFDGSPVVQSYLKFDLSGVAGTISKATLRVYANTSSGAGYTVGSTATTWTETGITAANAPPITKAGGSSGAFAASAWTSVDVTALLSGSTLSVALSGINGTAVRLSSREGGAATAPQLVLELSGAGPSPPVASFTASTLTQTAGLPISFTDTSTGSPTAWTWDFGDGTGSSLQNPSHTWTTPGPYTVSLTASNAAGPSVPAATAGVTINADGSPPTDPTNFTATANGSSEIDLAWTASTDNVGVAGYTIYRTDLVPPLVTLGPGATSYADTSLAASTTYSYSIVASDAAGNVSNTVGPASATTAALPSPPVASFTASTTTQTAGLPIGFTDTSTGSPTSWSWNFGDGTTSTLQNPTHSWTTAGPYTVSLTASNAAGPSVPAATVGITINADMSPPSDPGSFTATANGSSEIDLSWTGSTDNVGVTDYTIYRSDLVPPLAVVGPGAVSYPDTGLAASSTYSYSIVAHDAAGNASGIVGPASATTAALPTGPITLAPIADSYVDSSNASANYGTSTSLRFDGSPIVQSYLMFDLSGVSGTITKATLRVYANTSSSAGYTVGGTATTWTETGITAANAPPVGPSVGSSGAFSGPTWTSVDVTSLVGTGKLSLAMSGINGTNVRLSSRESGAATAPQLVLEFGP